jgi:hypothetical protein
MSFDRRFSQHVCKAVEIGSASYLSAWLRTVRTVHSETVTVDAEIPSLYSVDARPDEEAR